MSTIRASIFAAMISSISRRFLEKRSTLLGIGLQVSPLSLPPFMLPSNEDAVSIEQGGMAEIGLAVLSALKCFACKDRNLRDSKRSDWPAFKASQCRTASGFERRFLRASVQALDDSDLIFRAECTPAGENEIGLSVRLNPFGPPEEIGGQLRKLFQAASCWDVMESALSRSNPIS